MIFPWQHIGIIVWVSMPQNARILTTNEGYCIILLNKASRPNTHILRHQKISLLLPLNSCAVCRLELQDHGEQGGVNVPDGGKDEGDDGQAGDAPDYAHLHLQ